MSPMEVQGMKVHRGLWEHEPTSLALGCKWLQPLVPKSTAHTTTTASFDLKSFVRPESGHRAIGAPEYHKRESNNQSWRDLIGRASQVETQGGGTRWNPTQEQIGILEMLYRSGMRTPNAQQIEQITVQLALYGKIEGKNVFYWFQNHKARERQKQKRNSLGLGLAHSPRTPTSTLTTSLLLSPASGVEEELSDGAPCKRKCNSWAIDQCLDEVVNKICTSDEEEDEEEEAENRTLKLFPLHPEGRY